MSLVDVDTLTMTPPGQIRETWPKVRDRIAAIAAECGEPWLAEDVFAALTARSAFLWGTEDLEGFLVLELAQQPHGQELHCWITANRTDAPPAAYWPQIVAIAQEHGCCRITFENDRAGFQRHIPGLRTRFKYIFEL